MTPRAAGSESQGPGSGSNGSEGQGPGTLMVMKAKELEDRWVVAAKSKCGGSRQREFVAAMAVSHPIRPNLEHQQWEMWFKQLGWALGGAMGQAEPMIPVAHHGGSVEMQFKSAYSPGAGPGQRRPGYNSALDDETDRLSENSCGPGIRKVRGKGC